MNVSVKWQTALVCVSVALISGCVSTSPTLQATLSPTSTAWEAVSQAPVLRQDGLDGVYELAVDPGSASLFVAASPSFEENTSGRLYRLDARSLQLVQTIQVPRRSFALALHSGTNSLFVGNTLDGSITQVDAASGQVKQIIQLAQPEQNKEGKTQVAHTRKVIVDQTHHRLFVTSPGRLGKVWIVDIATGQILHTIQTEAPWTAGAAYDAGLNRLYVSQGGKDEILAINPDTAQIVQRYSTGDSLTNQAADSKHFFVNMALDEQGQRLFAADASTSSVYVFDAKTGQILKQLALQGEGILDVLFNASRQELVVSNRGVSKQHPNGTGAVSIFDANTYAQKRSLALEVHPNSLSLSADGNTLYASVKTTHSDTHPAWRQNNQDSVVRIDLP